MIKEIYEIMNIRSQSSPNENNLIRSMIKDKKLFLNGEDNQMHFGYFFNGYMGILLKMMKQKI